MSTFAPRTVFPLAALIALSIACGRNGLDEALEPEPVGTTGSAGASSTGAAGTFANGSTGTFPGTAGTFATGSAGSPFTGAAGTFATGAAGTFATGAAGTFATGTAGTFATGAAGATPVQLPVGVKPSGYVPVMKTISDCSFPVGQPYEPVSAAETASLLVGRWLQCDGNGASSVIPPGSEGMEFARDRRWRALNLTGGMLVPATGFDTEGVWYLAPEDPKDMLFLNKQLLRIKLTGKGANGVFVDFLQNPTRMRTSDGGIFVWRGE